jgi:hypothetical protein
VDNHTRANSMAPNDSDYDAPPRRPDSAECRGRAIPALSGRPSSPRIPPTLDAYLATVVTPTLEAQKRAGCLGVKFEAAYLRSLA